jgi:5'-3' exonuclease
MGIPWYFYTIYKKYNTENDLTIDEETISKSNIDCLFLDYNSMIHPCAQRTLDTCKLSDSNIEDFIIEDCLKYTRYILNVVKPKSLYIMIDGVAPRAKINQQRERRYKSHFFKQFENLSESDDSEKTRIRWNSNKITPGTTFMKRLSDCLQEFKTDILTDCCYLNNVIISDSDDPGEGEHKMMKYISHMPDKKICIYGLDADLIMLSLMNENANNIVLIRDNTFNTKLSEQERVYTYLDIQRLKKYVCKDLRSDIKGDISDKNIIYDYIFLCFLLGNDFLEHIPSLLIKEGGLNVLVKYYTQLVNTKYPKGLIDLENLNNNRLMESINTSMLKDLFYHLSKTEELFFKNIYSAYKKDTTYRDKYDMDLINETISSVFLYKTDHIRYNQQGYKKRYYQYYNTYISDSKNVNDYCNDYMMGLYWVLGYYNNHCHNNWSWYYKHHAVPFASDIYHYLLENSKSKFDKIQRTEPIVPLKQLLMVLPKQSLLDIMYDKDRLLYEKLRRIFNSGDTQLIEYYPDKIYLDMINKEYLWQAKIFLKQFNNQIIDIFL